MSTVVGPSEAWLVVGVADDDKVGGGLTFVGVFISGCAVTRLTRSIESVVMSIELVTSSSLLLLKTAAAASFQVGIFHGFV